MSNWEWKKIRDVCVFIGDGDWIESKDQSSNGIRLIQTGNIGNGIYLDKRERSHYISEKTFHRLHCTEIFPGDCLISRLPEPIGRACVIPDIAEKMITAVDCTIIRFCESIVPSFFIYYTQSNKYFSDVKTESTGATRKRISRKNLENIKIPVPPLAEQKRIVKTLDEKFAKIDKLKTAAETNLKNAREFFITELKNILGNSVWDRMKLSDLLKLKSGDYLNSKDIVDGKYPVYGGNGIIAYHNDYNINGNNVIIGRVGALCGNVRFITEPIWLTDNAFKIMFLKDCFDYSFITYLLNFLNLRSYARQAAQPVISNSSLKDVLLPLPPLSEQKRIVAHLDKLSEKVKRLEEIYRRTIDDCEELKKSILKQVFEVET